LSRKLTNATESLTAIWRALLTQVYNRRHRPQLLEGSGARYRGVMRSWMGLAGVLIASSSLSGYAFSQAATEATPGNGSLVVSIQGAEHEESVCREASSAASVTTQAAQGNAAPRRPLAVPCNKQELPATDAHPSVINLAPAKALPATGWRCPQPNPTWMRFTCRWEWDPAYMLLARCPPQCG
jgi:hypothetical protein